MSKRVVVAMSGGVDSSVAAFLLKEQGYEVIGISLKTWDETSSIKRTKTCCSFQDIEDARKVCERLDVPFYAFNYKKEFEEKVIKTFVSEYYQGRTPNPCILCNQHIKFDQLLKEAEKLGAAYLATGHYARLRKDESGIFRLLKGMDPNKDQSYVLYKLSQEQLSKILFPIGEYNKEEIRRIAIDRGLPTATKPESQDICFIPDRDHAKFIQKHYPAPHLKPGNFVDAVGKILGTHQGIHAYTIGQRRGLGIGFGERMYVTRIDVEKNEVELGLAEDVLSGGLIAREVYWLNEDHHQEPTACGVKIRYQKDEIPAQVEKGDDSQKAVIRFSKKYRAVTPGQTAVFYRGDEVLGGGVIERAL
jgi:tRNA-uridine 2-sulfurtransferase